MKQLKLPDRSGLAFTHMDSLGVSALECTRSDVEHHGLFAVLDENEIQIRLNSTDKLQMGRAAAIRIHLVCTSELCVGDLSCDGLLT